MSVIIIIFGGVIIDFVVSPELCCFLLFMQWYSRVYSRVYSV